MYVRYVELGIRRKASLLRVNAGFNAPSRLRSPAKLSAEDKSFANEQPTGILDPSRPVLCEQVEANSLPEVESAAPGEDTVPTV